MVLRGVGGPLFTSGLPVATDAGALRVIPSWCSWLPFSQFTDACRLWSDEEIRQGQIADLAHARAACASLPNPEACIAAWEKPGTVTPGLGPDYNPVTAGDAAAAAIRASDPEGSCARDATLAHPAIAGLFGDQAACSYSRGAFGPYILLGVAGLAGLVLFMATRR